MENHNIVELSQSDVRKYLRELYDYCQAESTGQTGANFEYFLKIYLENIGLDEVEVTQRTRDKGIDLKAIRKPINEFGNVGIEKFVIQAKCNQINKSIRSSDIDRLRGVLRDNERGLFITTAKVSDASKDKAANWNLSSPIIVIDGEALISSCIQRGIGFNYKPVFNSLELDEILNPQNLLCMPQENIQTSEVTLQDEIKKPITSNDIRARIISIPSSIMQKIPNDVNEIKVSFNENEPVPLSVNRSRNFLGSVTDILRRYGLIKNDGTFNPKDAFWSINEDRTQINIRIATERNL
jgi:restriction system protein